MSITTQILEDIEAGMTEASKWVHDSVSGLKLQIPDTQKAETDLTFFNQFDRVVMRHDVSPYLFRIKDLC